MARNIITYLDIGSSSVRAIVVERKRRFFTSWLRSKESAGVRRGYINDLDDASKTISATVKSLEKISYSSIRNAIVSVGGISLGSYRSKAMIRTSKADGEITDHDIKRLIAQSEANLTNIVTKSYSLHPPFL